MAQEPATRIFSAWAHLEAHLRNALPACAVTPPNQPSELLSALRINHSIDAEGEERIRALRERRNLAAHGSVEPTEKDAHAFEAEVASLLASLALSTPDSC